jgi:hypothetical protein
MLKTEMSISYLIYPTQAHDSVTPSRRLPRSIMLRTLKPPASHLLRSAQTHTSPPLLIQLRLWQRNVTDYASKYSQKLENAAQQ